MSYRLLLRRLPQISSPCRKGAGVPRAITQSPLISNTCPKNHSSVVYQTRKYHITRIRLDEAADDKNPETSNVEEVVLSTSQQGSNAKNGQDDNDPDFKIPKFADRPADCPEWQNPQHHKNPEMQKMFTEDFPQGEMPILPLPPLDGRVPPHIDELANEIVHLNMLEMRELVKMVQEHFGFSTADIDGDMMVGVGGGDGGGAGTNADVPVVEEKTAFDLRLTAYDEKAKIKVIKEVRAIAGLGLKEAKELVEGAPKIVKKGIKKEEAEELKAKLEEIGATIEIV